MSTPGHMPLDNSDAEKIDLLSTIETKAQTLARSFESHTASLQQELEKRFKVHLDTLDVEYQSLASISELAQDSVANLKALIEKCYELDEKMAAVEGIRRQLKEIQDLLNIFE